MMSIYSRQCRYRTKSRPFFCLIFFARQARQGSDSDSVTTLRSGFRPDTATEPHSITSWMKPNSHSSSSFSSSSPPRSCLTLSTLLCK